MQLAMVHSCAQLGLAAPAVRVEVHLANGLPAFNLVGLPETVVRESKDRVRSALLTAGFSFPDRRITVNLSPADLPKEGGRFDLPIALGILVASGQLPAEVLQQRLFVGELALNGELRPVRGILSAALHAVQSQLVLVMPQANAAEAALVNDLNCVPSAHLLSLVAMLADPQAPVPEPLPLPERPADLRHYPDLQSVKGQQAARRALEVAAAGGHNLLFSGPPGSGKTLLASCMPGILPPLDDQEALEVAALTSLVEGFDLRYWKQRPFRAPHHTSSAVALVGGGSHPKPGEISLAHRGVLFLDELPEFQRRVLESLREPLESGEIHLSRATQRICYPARFMLLAAMNPCPCGHLTNPAVICRCTPQQVARYRSRISGPLLERMDLLVEVPLLPVEHLWQTAPAESSQQVRQRVVHARARQLDRSGKLNATLKPDELMACVRLSAADQQLLSQAVTRLQLSARSVHRLLKVALTLADLQGENAPQQKHILEALSYRQWTDQSKALY